MELSLNDYTPQELIEALESVDDIAYPQRALALVTQLITITNQPIEAIIEQYQSSDSLSKALAMLIEPIMTCDRLALDKSTLDKLHRLTLILEA